MKKLYVLFLSFICLCSLGCFADHNYSKTVPQQKNCPNPCPQTYQQPTTECFLCTNKPAYTLFKQMNLSETQICTAMKIQDKYALEVLSLNERIKCEEEALCRLKANCAKNSEIRKQNKLIKKLKKDRKEICKCYEKQFKSILSDQQKHSYNKYKKCK